MNNPPIIEEPSPNSHQEIIVVRKNELGNDKSLNDNRQQKRERELAQQYARRTQQLKRWTAVFALVFVLTVCSTIIALLEIGDAQTQRDLALTHVAQAVWERDHANAAAQTAYAAEATVTWQMRYFELEQERAATLAGGGIIVPASASTQSPAEFIATVTQVTELNNWEPVIETGDYGVEMVLVPAGCFWMGSVFWLNELPVHEVCFNTPFWIDRYEVTNVQFERLGGEAQVGSRWTDPSRPRERITWFEARDFCELRGARLPTEAEWEYAARGPDGLIFPWGNDFIADNVVYYANSTETTDVGSRPQGVSWVGAYDMSGNVLEWVADWLGPYSSDRQINPAGPEIGVWRALRGGSWSYEGSPQLRTTYRFRSFPERADLTQGFRCARSN